MKDKPELLSTENLKAVHAKLMRTLKVQVIESKNGPKIHDGGNSALHYVNAGCTRQTTQKSAVVRSHQYNLAFCPVEHVDQQLDYICKMGRVRLLRPWHGPLFQRA